MTEQGEQPNDFVEEQPPITDRVIEVYKNNKILIGIVRSKFKRLKAKAASNIVKAILSRETRINIQGINKQWKGLYQYNMALFDKNKNLKKETYKEIKKEIDESLRQLAKELVIYDERKHKGLKVEKIDGKEVYIVDKHTNYEKVRTLICDESEEVLFRYDFDNPDLPVSIPRNVDSLQRCHIQVLGNSVKFDYPTEYVYFCGQCGHRTTKKVYETLSQRGNIKCNHLRETQRFNASGDLSTSLRTCGTNLNPDGEISYVKDAFYSDIGYDVEVDKEGRGKKANCGGICFSDLTPGFYEVVMLKINNPKKTEMYQIIDTKEMEVNVFNLPKKVGGENYLITLQREFDKYVANQTGMEIFGLNNIKVALIVQKLFNILGESLICNVQVVGDASTGKSTVFKYYGYLLNGQRNLSTNGLSVSVPAMRGTRVAISLMGKEQKIVTVGHLGTYHTIHIDEAAENPELIQNLKTFLVEANYSYDKAGATGIFHSRTAQVNISQNLRHDHLGQYRGTIRKAYKDVNYKIGDDDRPDWDEKWDLHLPLFRYTNPYLYKIVKEKRIEYAQKQQWWIDGYDYALHERFPFYYYLVNQKENQALIEVVKRNVAGDVISDNLKLMKRLKTDSIDVFFSSLKKYKNSASDIDSFDVVDKILDEYGIEADARTKAFYYTLMKVSRIANQRMKANDEDFYLLRWVVENTNAKIDIMDTVNYEIQGPPDLEQAKETERQIEEESVTEGQFGMPETEFD